MKKVNLNAFYIFSLMLLICLVGCRKQEIKKESNSYQQFEEVSRKFGFKLNKKFIPQLVEKYETADNWNDIITKSKESKKELNQIENNQIANIVPHCADCFYIYVFDEMHQYLGRFQVPNNMLIYDALEQLGLQLHSCDRAGASSTCVAKISSGIVDQSNQSFLTDFQIDLGYFLPCASYPMSDLVITLHQEANMPLLSINNGDNGNIGDNPGNGGGNGSENWESYLLNSTDFSLINEIEGEFNQANNHVFAPDNCHGTNRVGNVFFNGTLQHWLIQFDYLNRNSNAVREYYIPTSIGYGYADLANLSTYELFEIKPENAQGISQGQSEIAYYVTNANLSCPTNNPLIQQWKKGDLYTTQYLNWPKDPTKILKSTLFSSGVITYSLINRQIAPPLPVVMPQPFIDRIKNLIQKMIQQPNNMNELVLQFFRHPENADILAYLKATAIGAGVTIIVGTIVEDFLTLGAGIMDDWASFIAAYRLIRFAVVM